MNNSKVKRSVNNIISGLLSQAIIMAFGLLIPRLVLINYGSEVNGLLNSLNQILLYLALLEAGIGTATTQALYGPLARGDNHSVSGIMSAANKLYIKSGRIYFISILLLSLVYPLFVRTNLSFGLVCSLILLNGSVGVINFYFQAKYTLLLNAEGKGYIINNLVSLSQIAISSIKIVLILNGLNVLCVQLAYFLVSILRILYIVWYIKSKNPWLDLSVEPNSEALSQRGSILIHQIGGLIFESTDLTVITFFLGLSQVSIYSMYALVFTMVLTIVRNVPNAVMFVFGQIFNTDRARYIKLLDVFEVYYLAFSFALFSITTLFCIPFLKLYTAGVTDANYIDPLLPYLFAIVYLLNSGRSSSNMTINFAQHFRRTQNRSLIEAGINLSVSLVAVNLIGIYGVLVGTIIALLYRTNDVILYANRMILKRNPIITYRRWITYMFLFVLLIFSWNFFNPPFKSYIDLLRGAIVFSCFVMVLFLVVGSAFNVSEFKEVYRIIKRVNIHKKSKNLER